MGNSQRNYLYCCFTFLFIVAVMPAFFYELFPFSSYPMLSQSWKTYTKVVAKNAAGKKTLSTQQVNSNYFGVPQDKPIGRSYPQTLLLFGKAYTSLEVKQLMTLIQTEAGACFGVKTFSQNIKGQYGLNEEGSFCLD